MLMKALFAKTRCLLPLACALLPLLLTGCETFGSYRTEEEMQRREDALILDEKFQKLSGRIEGLEIEVQQLSETVNAVQTKQGAAMQSQTQSLQARLDALEARLRTVEVAREKDKQEIVDKLSQKMSQIMTTSSSSGGSKKTTKRSHADSGYEHEVQPGDTLSAIAAAYGVTSKIIIDNNDIKDPNRLRVGQKLFIPG